MQSLALYLALSGLTAALPAPEAIRVPLPRRSSGQLADGSADLLSFFSSLNRTLAKHHAGSLAPMDGLKNFATAGLVKRGSSGSIPLVDQVEMGQDELYYGSGGVGSQTFTFDFDTGSSDIFIPGPACTSAQGCPGKVKYNQKGTDRHMTTSVTYGSGQVSGEDYYDSVTIAGLTAKKQNVISLTQAQGFSGSNSDGLLGMGFSTIAESKSPTYFETLISQGSVAAQEFSFYLGRAASNTGSKSELTIGGRDSKKFTGAVTSVPVTQKGYWQVAIDGISANGQQALLGAGQAAIDTGTTIVLGPTADLLSLFANVPGAIPIPQPSLGSIPITLFAVPCNQIPTINLGFAGKKFAINPLDLNGGQLFGPALPFLADVPLPLIDLLGSGACLLNVAAADINPTSPLYIVGDTFLKNWYSIFSYAGKASVNFAKSV